MQANTFILTLEEAYMISPNVKHFIFKTESNQPLSYTPGQFITIHFEHQDAKLHRSYSIANAPHSSGYIELAAGFVQDGPGTTLLFNLKKGDAIHATGPFGRLILKTPTPKRYIFAATSTGITPYRAMLPALEQQLEQDDSLSVIILQGVQTKQDLLYHDEFLVFSANHPRVSYHAYLSRDKQPNALQHEYSGYVQHAFPTLQMSPTEDIVYLCGNPSMIDEAFAWLKTHDFPLQHIIREKYISR